MVKPMATIFESIRGFELPADWQKRGITAPEPLLQDALDNFFNLVSDILSIVFY